MAWAMCRSGSREIRLVTDAVHNGFVPEPGSVVPGCVGVAPPSPPRPDWLSAFADPVQPLPRLSATVVVTPMRQRRQARGRAALRRTLGSNPDCTARWFAPCVP